MWELIFLMVILKIPIAYLCWIVYWAIKSEPRPDDAEGALVHVSVGPQPPSRPRGRRPQRPVRPHGGPTRSYARSRRVAATTGRR